MLKARFVAPVDGPVIENGGVMIREATIEAVGPADMLPNGPTVDFGQAVICPGFVNAHTHLEFSQLAGAIPPSSDFAGWLGRLTAAVVDTAVSRETVQAAMAVGIAQSLSSGVTTVGDITRYPQWTREALAASPLGGVSFGEVIAIGRTRALLSERLDAAVFPIKGNGRLRSGIAPHSPYTVEPEAMRACAAHALRIDAPLCIHLLESADEDSFTKSASGALAEHLRRVGAWDESIPISSCGPVELALATGLLTPRTIIAHGNYATAEDIERIAQCRCSVAYCPRTHQAFGHPPHPFRAMLAAGINVCVGTDSLASNPGLSVLDELRWLRRTYPEFPAGQLLLMGTLAGAKALGCGEVVGSISTGKRADLAVLPLESGDSWESVLDSSAPPVAVYLAGMGQSVEVADGGPPDSGRASAATGLHRPSRR